MDRRDKVNDDIVSDSGPLRLEGTQYATGERAEVFSEYTLLFMTWLN